ncbi:hypothetical protein TNIN_123671 [Trichonephila inaurata madagascariensis]|uniref:Uncharacterized protein n=1 Tax=Trichonephila inaurata madagascariensis TaxID=2747483 RepID=A0A8X6XLP1_9ARAC|nr:hypothetical protein TNIN_123671 [Trichonephila inaurata madagascariensis]
MSIGEINSGCSSKSPCVSNLGRFSRSSIVVVARCSGFLGLPTEGSNSSIAFRLSGYVICPLFSEDSDCMRGPPEDQFQLDASFKGG